MTAYSSGFSMIWPGSRPGSAAGEGEGTVLAGVGEGAGEDEGLGAAGMGGPAETFRLATSFWI